MNSPNKLLLNQTILKRVLFIGTTGCGKSTLINALYNDNAKNPANLKTPAVAKPTTQGVTADFTSYFKLGPKEQFCFTDSIGFGDSRFTKDDIISIFRSLVTKSKMGFHRIFVCVRYGRWSDADRKNINVLVMLFRKERLKSHGVLVITFCDDDEMDLQKYIQENKDDKEVIQFLEVFSKVIFGSNQAFPTNPKKDEFNLETRESFRLALKDNISTAPVSSTICLPPEGLSEILLEIIKYLFLSFVNSFYSIGKLTYDVAKSSGQLALDIAVEHHNYFGECPICCEDLRMDVVSVEKCSHIFHEKCLTQWFGTQRSCPLCRLEL